MKTNQIFIALLLLAFMAYSCGGAKKDTSYDKTKTEGSSTKSDDDYAYTQSEKASVEMTDEESPTPMVTAPNEGKDDFSKMVSSSAAQMSRFDSTRKLIRTAELKFRAVDVVETTYKIEDLIKRHGGIVESTYLSSEVSRTETTRISSDSLIESTHYHFLNEMVVRVPAQNLDTTLKGIAPMIDFLDYRNIKAEDVSFTYLRKQLEKKRLDLYNLQVSNLTTSGTNGDRLAAMEAQLEKQIENDESLLERLEMDYQVKYATITLHIYGRDKVRNVMLPDDEKISSYKPGFGKQLLESLEKGWFILKSLVLGLISIWPLWVAGLVIWYVIVYTKRRLKSKKGE